MSDSGKQRWPAKDIDSRAELRRFKNREAARRVRERKSNQLNTLQGQVDELKRENQKLLLVIQQLQSTTLTGQPSSLGLYAAPAAAAAPSVSARPADSMDSNPSAAPGQSPINSIVRSGPHAVDLPRLHAIIEPYESCPVEPSPCIMSQPGNALQSGALVSSATTLLPGTMSAPVLAQQGSLRLGPDEVALQRTCGCCGEEECEECEGVRVTMCSNSSMPLITTPGPKPKPLTLDDLNLPVTVLETSEMSQGGSDAAAATGAGSSRAVSSGKRQLVARGSFNSKERCTVSEQQLLLQQQQAAALARQGSNQITFHSQQQRIGSSQQQEAAAAAGAMDLDLVETLEPTRPRAAAAATAAAVGVGSQIKNYAGTCYMRKSSANASAAWQQQQQDEQGPQKLPKCTPEMDIAAAAAAALTAANGVSAGGVLPTVVEMDSSKHNAAAAAGSTVEDFAMIPGIAEANNEDLAASLANSAAADTAAAAAGFGDVESATRNICTPVGSAAANIPAAAAAAAGDMQAVAIAGSSSAAAAAETGGMEFIPMLPGPIATGRGSDYGAAATAGAAGSSSGKHHKGPKFLRNLAAAVGGLVRPGKSASNTPTAAAAAGREVRQHFGMGSMSFTAAAAAPGAAGGSSSFAADLGRLRCASETGAAAMSQGPGGIGQMQSPTATASQQQQQQQLFSDLMQLQQKASMTAGGPALASPTAAAAAAADLAKQQQQEYMLLQQQQQEILQHQRLLRQQLQLQQRHQQQQFAAASGNSMPNMCLQQQQQQQQQYGSSPAVSPHMWSSLSASAAVPDRISSLSSSSAATAAAGLGSWPCNTGAWQQRQQQQWMQGPAPAAAAAAAGLTAVVDEASEEDAVMQLALQEGILLSGA